MSVGVFTDRNHPPTESEIGEAIGPMLPAWQMLAQHIRERYLPEGNLKFLYGKSYGWAWRFRVKGKLLTALYPTKSGFTVQIILSPPAIEQAERMKLGKNVRQAIADANPYPEGRWLFIRVESSGDVRDVQRLFALKTGMKRPRKRNA
jgi:hypothetical protein